MKIALPAVLVVAALVSGAPAASAAPVAEVLAPLPGHTSSKAFDINEFDVVVGQSYADVRASRAVRWDDSGVHALEDLGHASLPYAISRYGSAAGWVQDAAGKTQAAKWSKTGQLTLLDPVLGASATWARDISDFDVAVGVAVIDGRNRAVRWDPIGRASLLSDDADTSAWVVGGRHVLGQSANGGVRWDYFFGRITSFGAGSDVKAMNKNGVVVGRLGNRATRWDADAPVQLPSGPYSWAYGVSDTGWVAGQDDMRAVLWDTENRVFALPPLPGQNLNGALAVNDSGVAVGMSGRFPVRWTAGEVAALPWLPGHFSGSVLTVNDTGAAIGSSSDGQGNPTAVLWR